MHAVFVSDFHRLQAAHQRWRCVPHQGGESGCLQFEPCSVRQNTSKRQQGMENRKISGSVEMERLTTCLKFKRFLFARIYPGSLSSFFLKKNNAKMYRKTLCIFFVSDKLVRYRSVVLLGNSVARAFGLKGQLFEVQKRGLTRLSSRAKIHVDLDQRLGQSFNLLPRLETNFCQVGVSTSLWGKSLLVWTSRRLVAVSDDECESCAILIGGRNDQQNTKKAQKVGLDVD